MHQVHNLDRTYKRRTREDMRSRTLSGGRATHSPWTASLRQRTFIKYRCGSRRDLQVSPRQPIQVDGCVQIARRCASQPAEGNAIKIWHAHYPVLRCDLRSAAPARASAASPIMVRLEGSGISVSEPPIEKNCIPLRMSRLMSTDAVELSGNSRISFGSPDTDTS